MHVPDSHSPFAYFFHNQRFFPANIHPIPRCNCMPLVCNCTPLVYCRALPLSVAVYSPCLSTMCPSPQPATVPGPHSPPRVKCVQFIVGNVIHIWSLRRFLWSAPG